MRRKLNGRRGSETPDTTEVVVFTDIARAAVDSLPGIAVLAFDRDMRFVAVHGAAIARHGYRRADVLGRCASDVIGPDRWGKVSHLYEQALAGSTTTCDYTTVDGSATYELTAGPALENDQVVGGTIVLRDVTALRAAEGEVAEKARQFQALAESAVEGHCRYNADGVLLWASQSMETITGKPMRSLIGSRARSVVHPDDLPRRDAAFAEMIRSRRPHTIDLRAEHGDGTWHWFESTVRGWFADDGALLEVHVTTRDVSRRRADDELREQWQLTFETTSRGIVLTDPLDGTIVQVNKAFADMHGGIPEDFEGRPQALVFTKESAARVPTLAEVVNRDGHLHYNSDHLRRDGSIFPVATEVVAARDQHGEPLYRVAFLTDLTEARSREAKERAAIARFERVFDEAPVGMMLLRSGRIERANHAAADLLGLTIEELELRDPRDFADPSEAPAAAEVAQKLATGLDPGPQFRRLVRADGHARHVLVRYSVISNGDNADIAPGEHDVTQTAVLVHLVDRTAEVEAERAREAALHLFATAVDQAPIGMCLVAPDGRFLRVNAALCRLLDRDETTLLAADFQSLTHTDDLQVDLDLLQEALSGARGGYEIEKRYLTPKGDVIYARLSVSLVRNDDGTPAHFVSQVVDLTETRRLQQRLEHLADTDALTGLHTRRKFDVELAREVERASRQDQPAALLALDLDGFKAINDTFGHAVGDDLLRAIGTEIRATLRTVDVLARLGGDEFAAVLPDTCLVDAESVARRLIEVVAAHGLVEDAERLGRVGVSIGITSIDPRVALEPRLLMAEADAAMYQAKAAGRNTVVVARREDRIPGSRRGATGMRIG